MMRASFVICEPDAGGSGYAQDKAAAVCAGCLSQRDMLHDVGWVDRVDRWGLELAGCFESDRWSLQPGGCLRGTCFMNLVMRIRLYGPHDSSWEH